MASMNAKTKRSHIYNHDVKLAGGQGMTAAKQVAEQQLRRLVMACLLWENNAYCDGKTVVEGICELIPQVEPHIVVQIAIEARYEQKLRHVPLLICREMAKHDKHKIFVRSTLAKVINRPDEITEFLFLYWKDNGKKTISAQVKKGLADAFKKFDEYQLSKYNRDGKEISLRDVLFLCHAKPENPEQEALWKRLINNELKTSDTWEVGLSAAKSAEEKRGVWERLIENRKLGASALLKNLRNMQQVGVARSVIARGLAECKTSMLLPLDFLKAAQYAPDYQRELEDLMCRCAAQYPKLPGWTIFVLDVSGSMHSALSAQSQFNRMSAGVAMTILAAEMCEHCTIYVTAGNDGTRTHATTKIRNYRGFALTNEIHHANTRVGGGGIFTRQCMDFIRENEKETPDRVIVFSDSQDCDRPGSGLPNPPGKHNYIVDVSSHRHGVGYSGVWDAEISGWSEHFLLFIAELESSSLQQG